MHLFKKMAFVFLPLAFFLFLTNNASAITVSPVVVDNNAAPGMKISGKVSATNDTDEKTTYYTSVQSFVPDGEEGGQKYLDEGTDMGLPTWFHLSTPSLTLEPNETKDIEYEITVPQNAEPGGKYATVFFSTTPTTAKDQSSVGVAAKTGIIFLVRIAGDVNEEANIESFTVNNKFISALPAMMSLRIRNTGSVHIRPIGALTIRNMWGGIVAKVPANPKNSAVLPSSIRRLDTWWAKSLNFPKNESFLEGLANEWRNFALGKYTATVDVKYGTKNQQLDTQAVSFWVFPWRMALILLGLLIILFFGLKIYNRTLINAALGKKESKK